MSTHLSSHRHLDMVWRTGRSVGRTIYAQIGEEPADDDVLIGVMDTAALAARAVAHHNVQRTQRETAPQPAGARALETAIKEVVSFRDWLAYMPIFQWDGAQDRWGAFRGAVDALVVSSCPPHAAAVDPDRPMFAEPELDPALSEGTTEADVDRDTITPAKQAGLRAVATSQRYDQARAAIPQNPCEAHADVDAVHCPVCLLEERDELLRALDAVEGGATVGPYGIVYREAGGGYEGLQAIARAARASVATSEAGGESR